MAQRDEETDTPKVTEEAARITWLRFKGSRYRALPLSKSFNFRLLTEAHY